MLRCVEGSYYTGHTDNLESRLAALDAGVLPGYTRDKRPGEFFDESRSSATGKADQGLDQAEEGGADSRRLGSFTDACQGEVVRRAHHERVRAHHERVWSA